MSSVKLALIAAAVVFTTTANGAFAIPATTEERMVLEGRSSCFGPFSIQFGKGVKIKAKFGYTLWSVERPEVVSRLNSENHTYLKETAAEWLDWNRRGLPFISVMETEVVDKPLVAGRPCIRFHGFQYVGSKKVLVAEFCCLQKSPVDLKVQEFWCKHYLLPAKCGFPVFVKQREGAKMSMVLDTKIIKSERVPNDKFQIPGNYKPAKDKADFFFSESGGLKKSDLEEFFQQPIK